MLMLNKCATQLTTIIAKNNTTIGIFTAGDDGDMKN